MTLDQVMKELASKGSESIKRTYQRHGAKEPFFGVKIGDLKPIQKKLKGCQDLALELYATKNSDAMYLAGLVADGAKMTRKQIEQWATGATWHMLAGCIVPWVASEHPDGYAIAVKWIDSPKPLIAVAGWATLAAIVTTTPDEKLPIKEIGALLNRCEKELKSSPDRVRYTMNSFIISCGTYVAPLAEKAIATARKIGKVDCDLGDTACEVPEAESYIIKCRRGAPIAPKRKTVRC